MEGIIQKGTGKIIHTSPDGKETSAIVYRDGKPWEGKLIYWHENGQKMSEQNIKKGVWHGRVSAWCENGQKALIEKYKNGKNDGVMKKLREFINEKSDQDKVPEEEVLDEKE